MTHTIARFDLNTIAADGHGRIPCAVEGFSSQRSIILHVELDDSSVRVEIERSASQNCERGYDPLRAEENYAAALLDMVNTARFINEHATRLVAIYNAAEWARTEATRARTAFEQAVIDSQQAIGEAEATKILERLVAGRGDGGFDRGIVFGAVSRGSKATTSSFRAKAARDRNTHKLSDKTMLYYNGDRISRAEALNIIASSSLTSSKFLD